MQRVVSINLNGNAYQLEENGYNALFAYLDATEAALKDSPDRAGKLAELERLIAEKCQALLAPHKTVITSAEIDRILVELGPSTAAAPGSSASSSSTSSNTTSPDAPNPPNPGFHRRLFQIRDGAMLGGVCVGLSEFLHVDVTVIRILFVIFALATSGFGILAYGVLMFAVPRVDTRAQASSGTAAGATHRWPWDEHGWPWDRHGWPWDQPKTAAPPPASQPTSPPPSAPPPVAPMPYTPHPHVFGTLTMIIFVMMGFFWLSFWSRGHLFFGWPFYWGFPHWIGIIVFFMMLRLIFMPFRMARWYGYGPYGGPYPRHYVDHPHYAWISMWNGMMWFAAMIFFVWIAFHYIPEVHDFIRSFQASWSDGTFHV